jgi:hypothetical protein
VELGWAPGGSDKVVRRSRWRVEIELTLPNAARIRAADFREPLGLADLRHRHDAIVAEARSISYHFRPDSPAGDRQELLDFVSHAIDRWKKLSREFAGPAGQ